MPAKKKSKSSTSTSVLVIGGGGREHALCWKLAQSTGVDKVFCAPGNGGTAQEEKVENVAIAVNEFDKLIKFAKEKEVTLTVVGPDNPISEGVVDAFESAGLRVFGPTRAAAQLEWSKAFAKEFMLKAGIPTPKFHVVSSHESALDFLRLNPWVRVIKADGLALGKGVFVCESEEECEQALVEIFEKKIFGAAGEKVVLEEKIIGEEVSLLMFCDGKTFCSMPTSQDHKRRFEDDKGPNTGGMGVYAPMPEYGRIRAEIESRILSPLRAAMEEGELSYKGILYAGIIYGAGATTPDDKKAQVLEFNARFGDPETQAILPLLDSDLYKILYSCTEGTLAEQDVVWSRMSSCCVVAAAKNYPESSSKGKTIKVGDLPANTKVFHAGTTYDGGKLTTNGGRVLAVNASCPTLQEARDAAYQAIAAIEFEDMDYRKDIAGRALKQCLSI